MSRSFGGDELAGALVRRKHPLTALMNREARARAPIMRAAQKKWDAMWSDPANFPSVSKTSTPVKGFASPAQANRNMSGSAVSKSPLPDYQEKRIAQIMADPEHMKVLNESVHGGLRSDFSQEELQAVIRGGSTPEKRRLALGEWNGESPQDRRQRLNATQTGPRGGRYYITKNGAKVYVK